VDLNEMIQVHTHHGVMPPAAAARVLVLGVEVHLVQQRLSRRRHGGLSSAPVVACHSRWFTATTAAAVGAFDCKKVLKLKSTSASNLDSGF
jgi:hypothetical protein